MRATILQKLITELLDFGLRDAAQPARAEKGLDVEPHMLFITVDRRGFEIFTPRALDPIIGSLLDGDALGCGDMNTVPHFSPDSFELGGRSFLLCELFIVASSG